MKSRTVLLLGEEKLHRLEHSRVGIFGLGGVGGTAAEALVRSGIGSLLIVDSDTVSASNLNRQILYTEKDVGKSKAKVAKRRLYSLGSSVDIEAMDMVVDEHFFENYHIGHLDFVIDAIDDCNGKLAIAKYCLEKDIPFLVSLGMANRLDPTQVKIIKLNQTYNDPLAKKIRRLYKGAGLDISRISCVFSSEEPIVRGETPASMMMVPSAAGLTLAYGAISFLSKGKEVA